MWRKWLGSSLRLFVEKVFPEITALKRHFQRLQEND
jgi:hypothetical protein